MHELGDYFQCHIPQLGERSAADRMKGPPFRARKGGLPRCMYAHHKCIQKAKGQYHPSKDSTIHCKRRDDRIAVYPIAVPIDEKLSWPLARWARYSITVLWRPARTEVRFVTWQCKSAAVRLSWLESSR